ncbi:MAG TPA: hypothetical protein VKU80_17540 [Planctomycetota bacterium]|nr:hypothetical protein [Planctomycetota bacterium]
MEFDARVAALDLQNGLDREKWQVEKVGADAESASFFMTKIGPDDEYAVTVVRVR